MITLGVRAAVMQRLVLERTEKTLETPWGAVRVKVAGGRAKVELDDLEALAARQGWSLAEAQRRLAPLVGGLEANDNP